MKTYTIGYDLQQPVRNYPKLISAIKSYPACSPALESQWLIQSSKTALEIAKDLWQHMDNDDKLLVMEVETAGSAWAGVSQETANWIKAA